MSEFTNSTSIRLSEKKSLTGSNYANLAKEIMESKTNKGGWISRLSTSKIRGIYSLIMNMYTRVTDEDAFEKNKVDLQYIKVKMAYESGRTPVVKDFIEDTNLMSCIDSISTYDQFILYCRYAESLIAYFKFYGGKE